MNIPYVQVDQEIAVIWVQQALANERLGQRYAVLHDYIFAGNYHVEI